MKSEREKNKTYIHSIKGKLSSKKMGKLQSYDYILEYIQRQNVCIIKEASSKIRQMSNLNIRIQYTKAETTPKKNYEEIINVY